MTVLARYMVGQTLFKFIFPGYFKEYRTLQDQVEKKSKVIGTLYTNNHVLRDEQRLLVSKLKEKEHCTQQLEKVNTSLREKFLAEKKTKSEKEEELFQFLDLFWKKLSRKEQNIVACIVREEKNLTVDDITELSNVSRSHAFRLAKSLTDQNILNICLHEDDKKSCYSIANDTFKSFVQEKVKAFDQKKDEEN